MDNTLFILTILELIPENHSDLIINDNYRYVLSRVLRGVFIYNVYERRTWRAVIKIYKRDRSIIKNHHEYLKLKYG